MDGTENVLFLKSEPVDEEELVSVIEIEEQIIKSETYMPGTIKEEAPEESQFVICSPDQDHTASDNDLDIENEVIPPPTSHRSQRSAKSFRQAFAGKPYGSESIKEMSYYINSRQPKFSCSQCKRRFYSKTALSSHVICDHVFSSHSCSVCSETFPTKNKLKIHIFDKEHYRHVCSVCKVRFPDQQKLMFHLSTHSGMLMCDECGGLFSKKSSLRTHVIVAHLGARFQCSICGAGKCFKSKKLLHIHLKLEHSALTHPTSTVISDSHPCKMKQVLYAPNFLEETTNSSNECKLCPQKFNSTLELMFHMKIHSKRERSFNCNICGSKYMHQSGLKRHIDTNHLGLRYNCDVCNMSFKSTFTVKMHKNKIHGMAVKIEKKSQSLKLEYKCEFCGKSYHSSPYYLNRHIKRAHLKPYVCNICNKKFGDKQYLQNHKLKHEKNSQFKCDFCNEIVSSKSLIYKHILSQHLGRKKYKCKVCEKTFYFRSSLNSHRNRVGHFNDEKY